MNLSDLMSQMGLHRFAEIGLVLFLLLFAGVLVHTFRRGNRERFERAARLPLHDDETGQGRAAGGGSGDA